MQIRLLAILAAFALVMAACGGSETAETTTTEGTPTTQSGPEAVLLSYALEPGTTLTYEVDLDQQIIMTSEGDGAVSGNDQMPSSMELQVQGSTTFIHTVSEGPEAGTYEITVKGEFTDLEVEGTVDGEPVAPGEVPDVADIGPIDMTIIVDEHGNPIPQTESGTDLFGGDLGPLGALGGLEGLGPGSELGRLVGPPLSDEPVTVGDTWSETIEVPMMMGADSDPITTMVSSEVVGTDTVEGEEVFVIDTEMLTSAIEFDLGEFLAGFFQGFLPDDASAEDQEDLAAMLEDLRFLLKVDETVGEMTTLFDPLAGVSRQADFVSATHLLMDLNMPDQATGEMLGFSLDMSVDQRVIYRLVDSSPA